MVGEWVGVLALVKVVVVGNEMERCLAKGGEGVDGARRRVNIREVGRSGNLGWDGTGGWSISNEEETHSVVGIGLTGLG